MRDKRIASYWLISLALACMTTARVHADELRAHEITYHTTFRGFSAGDLRLTLARDGGSTRSHCSILQNCTRLHRVPALGPGARRVPVWDELPLCAPG